LLYHGGIPVSPKNLVIQRNVHNFMFRALDDYDDNVQEDGSSGSLYG